MALLVLLSIAALVLLSARRAHAADSTPSAVWQWSIVVKGGRDKAGPSRAFLWIPQDVSHLRGVVVAQNNMEEKSILENPIFRRTLAEMGFGEIWVSPAFDLLFHFNEGAGDIFDGMMRDLANESGYRELNWVPVAPLGHSASASWPYYFAAWNPQRTLAALSVSGQWPYFRHPSFAPDIWGDRNIDFVPCLESMGEYESADSWSTEGLLERQQHPHLTLSMLANPGEGHFAATDAKITMLALYLVKADRYRIPRDAPVDSAPTLIPIDPTKTGWLADRWRKDQSPTAPAAPVGKYTGDPQQAFWFFDQETIRAFEAHQSLHQNLKPQLVGFTQNGAMVPQQDEHLQVTLKFEPDPDGVTFHVGGAFYDTVPGGSPRPAAWANAPAGTPIGHASDVEAISIDRVIGPFEKVGPSTFRLQLQKETIGTEQSYELVFAATHPGDAVYKPAVQQAHMTVPARNVVGADQTITFPPIADVRDTRVGPQTIELRAKSTAGVPVRYYVREGPAVVDGDKLSITRVPLGARYPVRVTVVAWQYGRASAPALKSATPVTQTFFVTK